MPASGKTTLGKQLAKKINLDFVDIDEEIEHKESATISDVFKRYGEHYFRQIEADTLRKIDVNKSQIVSCGGGLPCYHDNILWMRQHGKVINIALEVEELLTRIKKIAPHRPLLQSNNKQELERKIKTLSLTRKFYFDMAHVTVDSRLDIEEIITRIL